jgi:glycosyl hydrolase family 57
MNSIDFGLVLNLHQPAGNLDDLLDGREWEAKEILWALDRIPRSLWEYEDVGRVHVSMSGTLLKTLSDPRFHERVYGIVDCGSLLWHLQNTRTIEVLGTAYYHPVLPLIPPPDREEQIARWLGLGRHLFWRDRFRGFWPPELGFCTDLVDRVSGAISPSSAPTSAEISASISSRAISATASRTKSSSRPSRTCATTSATFMLCPSGHRGVSIRRTARTADKFGAAVADPSQRSATRRPLHHFYRRDPLSVGSSGPRASCIGIRFRRPSGWPSW